MDALRFDRPLLGQWLDRTRYNRARRRGQDATRRAFTTEYTVRLTPPPALSDLSSADFRELIEQQRRDAIGAGRDARAGRTAVGAKRILRQDPHQAPRASKRTPGPRFHVAEAARRKTFTQCYRLAVAAYREAVARLAAGIGAFAFPLDMIAPTALLRPVDTG